MAINLYFAADVRRFSDFEFYKHISQTDSRFCIWQGF